MDSMMHCSASSSWMWGQSWHCSPSAARASSHTPESSAQCTTCCSICQSTYSASRSLSAHSRYSRSMSSSQWAALASLASRGVESGCCGRMKSHCFRHGLGSFLGRGGLRWNGLYGTGNGRWWPLRSGGYRRCCSHPGWLRSLLCYSGSAARRSTSALTCDEGRLLRLAVSKAWETCSGLRQPMRYWAARGCALERSLVAIGYQNERAHVWVSSIGPISSH